jgi:dTDP-4-dehydrorhamnose reductase
MEEEDVDCPVIPILSKDFPTPARRPTFSVLDKSRWKEALERPIPHWRASLRHCLVRIRAGE